MPKTKYKSDYNAELQDPEAIFTVDSVIGEDIMAFNSSSNKAKSSGLLKETVFSKTVEILGFKVALSTLW